MLARLPVHSFHYPLLSLSFNTVWSDVMSYNPSPLNRDQLITL